MTVFGLRPDAQQRSGGKCRSGDAQTLQQGAALDLVRGLLVGSVLIRWRW